MKSSVFGLKINLVTVVSALFLGYVFYKYVYDGTEQLTSNVDKRVYRVRKGDDMQVRADILAILNGKFQIIVNNLKNDPAYQQNIAVKRLISNWESGVTLKEIGNMESDAAYVINKRDMSFCLQKTKNQLVLEELNLITYVGIHELAHIMSEEVGHGSEFIKNFEFLLNYAKQINYYDPLLRRQLPLYIQLDKLNTKDSYCGVNLENSVS